MRDLAADGLGAVLDLDGDRSVGGRGEHSDDGELLFRHTSVTVRVVTGVVLVLSLDEGEAAVGVDRDLECDLVARLERGHVHSVGNAHEYPAAMHDGKLDGAVVASGEVDALEDEVVLMARPRRCGPRGRRS